MNPHAAAEPYTEDHFKEACPRCGTTNEVTFTPPAAPLAPEPYECARCGTVLGTVRSALLPRVAIVS